jgi:hypothetical protein
VLISAVPRAAVADRLLVYGPPGSGAERRALAVIEQDDGTCGPWDGAEVVADEPGVEVAVEPAGGPCTRWLRIASSPPRPSVTLRVRAPSRGDAQAAVAMGGSHDLRVRASREGRTVRVVLTGAPPADTVVTAIWRGGEAPLSANGAATYEGEVPGDELVAVVARSGDLVGADALPPTTARPESQTLVVPSALAVPAGAAVRTAAFVVATDRRGRLSRDVPLHVSSDRGRLRSLTWLEPGVAAVALTADASMPSVDLRVWTTSESDARTIEIPVQADWPVGALIDAPAQIERGHDLLVNVTATLLAGAEATDAVGLAVRCGARPATRDEGGRFRCAPGDGPSVWVIATALIDGRVLPLAQQRVEILQPPPLPVVAPPPGPRPRARPVTRPAGSPLVPAASLAAGVDAGGNAAWGAGFGARWWATDRLFVTATARYAGARVDAPGAGIVSESLIGTRHGAELLVGAAARVIGGRTSLVVGAAVGPSWVLGDLRLGNTEVPTSALRLVAQASAGPRTRLGGLEPGIDLGVRLVPASSETTWREPLATAYVEVSGAAGAR